MLSNLNPTYLQFLNGLNAIQQRAQTAQNQLTTGLKLVNPADDPGQVADLLATRSSLAGTQQIDKNLVQIKSEVDTSESALQSAVSLVQNAQTLGSQAESSALTTPATRQNAADQLGGILTQLVAIANTSVNGRFVFSGDSDQTQPYSIDLTQANPISSYQGSVSTRQAESADGSSFSIALTAQTIFDGADATQNVFQNISNLRTAMLNNDQTGIDNAIGNLSTSSAYLNQQLAFYGNTQNNVAAATTFGSNHETQLQSQISDIQDADLSQAILSLTQAQTQQQAALSSESLLSRKSLFDYLA